MKKVRILAVLLILALVFMTLPLVVFAADDNGVSGAVTVSDSHQGADVQGQDQSGTGEQQAGAQDQKQTADTQSQDRGQTGSQDRGQTGSQDQDQTGSQDQGQTGSQDQDQTGSQDQGQTGSQDQGQTGSQDQSQTSSQDQSQTGSQDIDTTGSDSAENPEDKGNTEETQKPNLFMAKSFALLGATPDGKITVNTGTLTGCTVKITQGSTVEVSNTVMTGSSQDFSVSDNGNPHTITITKVDTSVVTSALPGDTVSPTKQLTVNTGFSGCTVGVCKKGTNAGYIYSPSTVSGTTATYDVLDNSSIQYEVRISKNYMNTTLYGYAGNTVNAAVKKITVNTGLVNNCTVGVAQKNEKGQIAGYVYAPAQITGNSNSYDVFDAYSYDVRVAQGGMQYLLNGQAGDTVTVPTYTIAVPSGMTNVGLLQTPTYSWGSFPGSNWVYQSITGPSQINVFKNNGSAEMRYTVNGQNRTDQFKLDGTTGTTLTADFTGMSSSVNAFLLDSTGTKTLQYVGVRDNGYKAVFSNVPAGQYKVKLTTYGGLTRLYDVYIYFSDFTSSHILSIPLVDLTVVLGVANVDSDIYVYAVDDKNGQIGNGSPILYTQDRSAEVKGLKIFAGQRYKIYFSKGRNFTDYFTVEADAKTYTYTLPKSTVTFGTSLITYDYGMNLYIQNPSNNNATAQYLLVEANKQYPVESLIPGTTYTALLKCDNHVVYSGTFKATDGLVINLYMPLSISAPADKTVESTAKDTPVPIGNGVAQGGTDFPVTITNNAPAAGFPLGDTTVTWTATDKDSHQATATQKVTVKDTTSPTITAPSDITVLVNQPLVPSVLGTATASDVFLKGISNDAQASYNTPGEYIVTWTAEDTSGNKATAEQKVTVLSPGFTTVTYDGLDHSSNISLPGLRAGDTVTYSYNGQDYTDFISAQDRTIKATVENTDYTYTVDVKILINKATLTVTADPVTLIYGDAVPATYTYQIGGYVKGDLPSVVSGAPDFTNTYKQGDAADTAYTVMPKIGSLSASNYSFSYTAYQGKVGKAALTITANDEVVTVGDPVPTYSASYTGFVNGDKPSSLEGTPVFTCNYAKGNAVGNYPIALDGLTSKNYMIKFVPGNLKVNAQSTATYRVIFQNYDGTTLKVQWVDRDNAATAPANPTRPGYRFTGWNADFGKVTGDMTITAQFALITTAAAPPAGQTTVIPPQNVPAAAPPSTNSSTSATTPGGQTIIGDNQVPQAAPQQTPGSNTGNTFWDWIMSILNNIGQFLAWLSGLIT